jgi:peptidoglycan/LPS O-acetylase OafA/YrhL
MGVDLFFVLSGFLITGILLDTKNQKSYFTSFYSKRCLRIWPLYAALLIFMFMLVPLLRPSETRIIFQRSSPWWAYPLFIQNFLVSTPAGAAGPLGVTWSLAVEEQFYLVWPLFVRFCSSVQLRRIALSVICIEPVLRLVAASHHVILYSNTFSRLDGLMAGALLATVTRSPNFNPSGFVKWAWGVLLIGLPAAFIAAAMDASWIVFSLSAAASASLVYLVLYSRQEWIRSVMGNRFLIFTGTVSYGLYLLHKIPFDVAEELHFDRHPLLAVPVLLAVCYGMAALSWSVLERPFLRLKQRFESPRNFTEGQAPSEC